MITTLTFIFFSLFIILLVLVIYLIFKLKLKEKKNNPKDFVQNLFDIVCDNESTDKKIKKLNEAILNTYHAKYVSTVLFDGSKNHVKATNVEEIFKDSISSISKDQIFKRNINSNVAKYITVNNNDTLLYVSAIERKIKSALMIPIYYNNSYLGYIFLEDTVANYFENITKEEIDDFKNNVGLFLEKVNYQSTIEVAEVIDKQTGFKNNMYLYSNARNILNEYEYSAIVLVYLEGLPDINEKYNRNIGNALLVKLANVTKEAFPKQTILIRYSGLRFLILMPGYTAEKAHPILERILSKYKAEHEYYEDEKVTLDIKIIVHTLKKQNNIEKEVQEMSLKFDRIREINTIKIV